MNDNKILIEKYENRVEQLNDNQKAIDIELTLILKVIDDLKGVPQKRGTNQ